MKRLILLFLLVTTAASAQQSYVYDDKAYIPAIKSVQLYPLGKEGVLPVVALRSTEQLLLSFDDISGQSRNLNYTIEHCDSQWQPSRISSSEYLQTFTEDRLTNYRYSAGVRQKYVHYEQIFPNQNITPKLSGNYLLKVYEYDATKPILTRRFYVVNSRVSISGDVVVSPNTALRETNQKLNFQLDYGNLMVQNPYSDIRVLVTQNARPQPSAWNVKPNFVRGQQLIYNDVSTNDFPGGNEFRHFDTRSLRLNSDRIDRIYRDTANIVMLLTDHPRDKVNFTFQYDNNGKFFIFNQDGRDSRTDADYAYIYFSLAANKTSKDGSVYIVGQFNNYQLNAESKLEFDDLSNRFYTRLYLKQGVYDFEYVWVDAATNKPDLTYLEGNHFETENDYQLLVYYKPAGARWEELVGYRVLNTGKK